MKNCIPSHLFLDVWLQKMSSCWVSLSDDSLLFSQSLEKSEISVYYKHVHFSATNETILWNNIAFH